MPRKLKKSRATIEQVNERVVLTAAQVHEVRVQQAQTETHLANVTRAVVAAGLQQGRDATSVLERMAKLEAIVAQMAEGFAIIQNDIAAIQRFVGRQTELLGEIKRATAAVPMTAEQLEHRRAEASRLARAIDV